MLAKLRSGMVVLLGAGCAGGVGEAVQPKARTAAEALGEPEEAPVCHQPGARGTPLVVDWPTQDRMDLEEAMFDGIAVVEYRCGKLALLRDCHVDGSYGFLGLSRREEVVQLTDADEIRANLPLEGSAMAASFGAELDRGRTLELAMVHSGKMRTTVASATRDQLRGSCEGATHLVRGAFVGAFAMATGSRGRVSTLAEVFEAGLRASSSSEKAMQRRDGSPDACEAVEPGAEKAPGQCAAAIRLELVAIGDAPAESQAATPAELQAQMACPDGMVVSGGKCTKEKSAPYRCSGRDASECQTQCDHGDAASCAILGSMYEGGHGVSQDHAAATRSHERACQAGVAYSCSRLGVMYFYGSGVEKNSDRAAQLFTLACAAGDADGCNNYGAVLDMGVGIERDRTRAAKLFVWACNGGDAQGCFNAMVSHRDGRGVAPDPARSNEFGERARAGGIVQLFEANCAGGNAYSCWGLGYMHQHGLFKPRDLDQAKKLYQQACPGIAWGCEALSLLGVSVPGLLDGQ